MIKRGFSLIEVMVALLISSMIIAGLFTTVYQVSDMQVALDNVITAHERAAIILHQFERDLMGVFIPEQIARIQTKEQEKKEEEKSIIDKIFYATQQDDQLDVLTFITNNPLETYLKIKNTKPKPRVARVVYRLVPEKGRKNSYTLMRQEGADLDFKKYKKDAKDELRAYPMVEGIASFKINYLKLDASQNSNEEGKRNYKKEKTWGTEKKDDKKSITLPEYVELIVSLWHVDYTKKTDFSIQIPIFTEPIVPKKPTPKPVPIFPPRPASTPPPIAQAKSSKRSAKPGSISITTLMQGAS